jgi:hypothetical protein
VAVPLGRLPRFLVLEPASTVRIEIALERPSCEIDVELQNPRPGRSFVLMIGPPSGPFVQRVRLSGRARILFQPPTPGEYVLVLANPQREPLVLKLRGHHVRAPPRAAARAAPRPRRAARPVRQRGARRTLGPGHRRRRSAGPHPRHLRLAGVSGSSE